jgi:hypothetical protein
VGLARAGLVVRSILRRSLPSRFRVRAGPRSNYRTLSDFQSGRVRQQPRSFYGELRGAPAEVGVEETACGLRPGRRLPPPIFMILMQNKTPRDRKVDRKVHAVANVRLPNGAIRLVISFREQNSAKGTVYSVAFMRSRALFRAPGAGTTPAAMPSPNSGMFP